MTYGTIKAGKITPGSGNTLDFTEPVTVLAPTAPTHPATKTYTDTAESTAQAYTDSAASQATGTAQGLGTGDSPSFAGLTAPVANLSGALPAAVTAGTGAIGQATAKAWVNFES